MFLSLHLLRTKIELSVQSQVRKEKSRISRKMEKKNNKAIFLVFSCRRSILWHHDWLLWLRSLFFSWIVLNMLSERTKVCFEKSRLSFSEESVKVGCWYMRTENWMIMLYTNIRWFGQLMHYKMSLLLSWNNTAPIILY